MYITFTTLTVNIILYMCVRVGMRTLGHAWWKPSGMDAAGFEPETEAGGSRFDMIHHAEQGPSKPV